MYMKVADDKDGDKVDRYTKVHSFNGLTEGGAVENGEGMNDPALIAQNYLKIAVKECGLPGWTIGAVETLRRQSRKLRNVAGEKHPAVDPHELATLIVESDPTSSDLRHRIELSLPDFFERNSAI